MSVEIFTKADLQQFKTELITELKEFLSCVSPPAKKKWLKSYALMRVSRINFFETPSFKFCSYV
jgi:hypothetical protein